MTIYATEDCLSVASTRSTRAFGSIRAHRFVSWSLSHHYTWEASKNSLLERRLTPTLGQASEVSIDRGTNTDMLMPGPEHMFNILALSAIQNQGHEKQ